MRLFGAHQGREISHGVEAPSACTAVVRKVEAQIGRCFEDGVTIHDRLAHFVGPLEGYATALDLV